MRQFRSGSMLAVVLLILCSCSWFGPPNGRVTIDYPTRLRLDQALHLLLAAEQTATSPRTFKGLGTIKWHFRGQSQIARAALAGALPDKLRIEILAATGQPVISLSSDGDSIFLLSHSDRRYLSTTPGRQSLSRLVTVPVSVNEITALLCARRPPFQYQKASLAADDAGQGYLLVLEKKWGGGLQKLYLNRPGGQIRWLEMYDGKNLSYRADFEEMQTVEGFDVPAHLVLTDAQGTQLRLEIDRYWAQADLAPDLFTLSPPDSWEQLPPELSPLLPAEP